MKKINDMVHATKMKLRQRGRLRTTTKLVFVFGVSTVMSIAIALTFLLNVSTPKELYGDSYIRDEVRGMTEIPQQKFITSFEVKELDAKNNAFRNDTSVQFKKVINEQGR